MGIESETDVDAATNAPADRVHIAPHSGFPNGHALCLTPARRRRSFSLTA